MRLKLSHAIVLMLSCVVNGPSLSAPQRKVATVSLSVLDSFGKAQGDCRVSEFMLVDDGINTDIANTDYKDHFRGSTGRDNPSPYATA